MTIEQTLCPNCAKPIKRSLEVSSASALEAYEQQVYECQDCHSARTEQPAVVQDKILAGRLSDRMEYQVTLQKDGRFTTYGSAKLFAASDDEAVGKAKNWAHSLEGTPEDAWLLVTMSGKGISTLRPGEF